MKINMQKQRIEYENGTFESFADIGCHGWDYQSILEYLGDREILDSIME